MFNNIHFTLQKLDLAAFSNASSFDWRAVLFADGERWPLDDEVISRLVEDAIDSESREILTLSRSRSVSQPSFYPLTYSRALRWLHMLFVFPLASHSLVLRKVSAFFPRFMAVACFPALLQLLHVFNCLATGARFSALGCGRVLALGNN